MLLAGMTGGVGSGKTTVADALERRGAVIIDTDVIAREVVAPGTLGFEAIKARFGRGYIKPDGTIDRRSLGKLVFADEDARADLNGIVHPLVRDVARQRVDELRGTDDIVLLVVPLLVESGHYVTDVVIVVDCPEEVAIERLVAARGWTEKDARRRLAAQVSRAERRSKADLVIDNGGSLDELAPQVDAAWQWLVQHRDSARR